MNIVSYRGPGMAGGVAPALKQLMSSNSECEHWWWFIKSQAIRFAFDGASTGLFVSEIPTEVVEGHYRYSNEFLWPVMHGLCEYAHYCPEDRALYERFNHAFAAQILRLARSPINFVQDYQLALVPQALRRRANQSTAIFWHIPWPKRVPARFSAPVIDLTKALLSADIIGFHTQEYAENFLDYVSEHLPEVRCDYRSLSVEKEPAETSCLFGVESFHSPNRSYSFLSLSSSSSSGSSSGTNGSPSRTTVVVQPLGLDVDYWSTLSSCQKNTFFHKSMIKTPYVLSVDRADYTKGVINRLRCIDMLFDNRPELKQNLTFAQICTRTRNGLEAFDRYWIDCQRQIDCVNRKHATEDWEPILNIDAPVNSPQLALLYRNASVMLVNPLKDGLNLTAKEFAACQTGAPGVLALSPAAGVWSELGQHAVEVDPNHPDQMADAVHSALTMSRSEKSQRVAQMINQLRRNTLSAWCDQFVRRLKARVTQPQRARRAIS